MARNPILPRKKPMSTAAVSRVSAQKRKAVIAEVAQELASELAEITKSHFEEMNNEERESRLKDLDAYVSSLERDARHAQRR